jgi:hypothetical protein
MDRTAAAGLAISCILPFLAASAGADPRAVRASPAGAQSLGLASAYGSVPLAFQENSGQADPRVRFTARGLGMEAFVTDAEVIVALADSRPKAPRTLRGGAPPAPREGAFIRMRAVGAAPSRPVGLDPLPGIANHFIGSEPSGWRTGIRTYSRVMLQGLYPGIDLILYGKQRELEYDLAVAPGADPGSIRLSFEGIDKLGLNQEGDLLLTIAGREVIHRRPVAYQEGDERLAAPGLRRKVEASYIIVGEREVAFRVRGHDPARKLIVDPVLAYSTYLGGSSLDQITGVAVDRWGNALVAGWTYSTDFPLAHPVQPSHAGGTYDAFVVKLNAAGDALLYSTYLGGSGADEATGIAVDLWGNAYVTGDTTSSDFPTARPFQPTLRGAVNAFAAKLDSRGSALLYSSYLGGSGEDVGRGIAVDLEGAAYVTGGTSSDDFPTEAALQPTAGGGGDGFVAKIGRGGRFLAYSTYLGGSGFDVASAIAVDFWGRAHVVGQTASGDFPTVNPLQPMLGGGPSDPADAFVARLSRDGRALQYSTYLGGSDLDQGTGIAADPFCGTYVTGNTFSFDFPTAHPLQPASGGGGGDAFVARLSCWGDRLVYSTYIGGSAEDRSVGIAVDLLGRAHVAGFTYSPDFPTVDPLQPPAGDADAYLLQLRPDGRSLAYSTRLGGSSFDSASAVAVDDWGNAYVAGFTFSSDFPTVDPLQSSGSFDGFVAKVSARGMAPGEPRSEAESPR